jgi:hypothetical protein
LNRKVCCGGGGGEGGKGNGSKGEMHLDCLFRVFRVDDSKGIGDNILSLWENGEGDWC